MPLMRRLLAVLSVLALAGCLSPTPALKSLQSVTPAAPVPLAPLARIVTVIDPAGGRGEPSMGVAPDGTLYANGRHTVQDLYVNGGVYASKDGGATWKFLAAPTYLPDNDPDLAVDKDGTIWFDTLNLDQCNSAASSRDGGQTWTSSPLACFPGVADRQYVIPTEKGTAYIYSHQTQTNYQCVAKTTTYGLAWVPISCADMQGNVPPGSTGRSGWGGGGFWNPKTGSIWMTFTWREGGKPYAAAPVSRDGGMTWTMVKLPYHDGGTTVGLGLVVGAVDQAGNVYLAWAETHDKDIFVYLAASKDDGRTWSEPVRLDQGITSKVFPAITAGAPGHVAVAYYESNEHDRPFNVSKDAYWNVTLATTTDALALSPSWSYGQLSTTPVHHGPICPNGSSCANNRQLLDYFALKTFADGRVASVWTSTEDVPGKTVNVFGATDQPYLV